MFAPHSPMFSSQLNDYTVQEFTQLVVMNIFLSENRVWSCLDPWLVPHLSHRMILFLVTACCQANTKHNYLVHAVTPT